MPEYDSAISSEEKHEAMVKNIALKDRAVVTTEDVYKGGSIHSSAVFWNNLLVFGAADKNVYALDKNTGKLVWKFATNGPIASSPFIDAGVIYACSYDNCIYALNAVDGSLLWKFRTGDAIYASPTVGDGIVHVGSLDNYHYALRASDGTLLWKFRAGEIFVGSPLVVNGMVIVAPDDGYIYAFDAKTGRAMWKYKATLMPVGGALATAYGKGLANYTDREPVNTPEKVVLCFGDMAAYRHLFMLDAKTGRVLADFDVLKNPPFGANISDGVYYCGSIEQFVSATDLVNKKHLWEFRTDGIVSNRPYVHDGIVYFGSYDQHLYAVDAKDGSPLWKLRTDGIITCPPVMNQGILYFGSWDTYFYAVDVAKREILWRFKTAAPPCKTSFISTLSTFSSFKKAIIRWWQPEKPRFIVYETKPKVDVQVPSVGPYKMSEPYKSEVKYQSSSPYEMNKEKKKDWHDPFRR